MPLDHTPVLALVALCAPLVLAACEEGPPPDPTAWSTDRPADGQPAPDPQPSPADRPPVTPPETVDDPRVVILDDTPLTLAIAEVTTLAARVLDADGRPVDASVTWRSDDPQVAWVAADGAVLGVSHGETTVYAEFGADNRARLPVRVEAGRPEAPSYAAVVDPILRSGCAVSGCHVDGVEPGDLRFDRDVDRMWEELVEDASEQTGRPRVAAGDPAGSYLLEKLLLEQPAVGGRMPLGRGPLPIDDLQAIVAWIAGGAPR